MFLIIQVISSFTLSTDKNLTYTDGSLKCKFSLTLHWHTLDVWETFVTNASIYCCRELTIKGIQQLAGMRNNYYWLLYCTSCTNSNAYLYLTTQAVICSQPSCALWQGVFHCEKNTTEQLVKTSPQKIFLISLFLYVISPWRFQLLQSSQVLLQSEQSEQAQHGGCDDLIT